MEARPNDDQQFDIVESQETGYGFFSAPVGIKTHICHVCCETFKSNNALHAHIRETKNIGARNFMFRDFEHEPLHHNQLGDIKVHPFFLDPTNSGEDLSAEEIETTRQPRSLNRNRRTDELSVQGSTPITVLDLLLARTDKMTNQIGHVNLNVLSKMYRRHGREVFDECCGSRPIFNSSRCRLAEVCSRSCDREPGEHSRSSLSSA